MRELLLRFRPGRRIPEPDKFPLPLWERVRERGHPPLTPPIKGGGLQSHLEAYKRRAGVELDSTQSKIKNRSIA